MDCSAMEVDPAVMAFLPEKCKPVEVTRHGKTNWSYGYKLDVELPDGTKREYFMKIIDRKDISYEMAVAEYIGTNTLRAIIPGHTPKPIGYGTCLLDKTKHFYICEFLHLKEAVPSPAQLIPVIKQLHLGGTSPTGQFGFPITTYKGYFPLSAGWCDSWEEFFTRQFRTELAWEKGKRGVNKEMDELVEQIFEKVIPRLLRPLQTGGRSIRPTLCHGDLWHGNVQLEKDRLVLFDSCAVYAHNEYELSSWRDPRYRLNEKHLEEYLKVMGKSEPVEDFEDRNALYALSNDTQVSGMWDHLSDIVRAHMIEEMKRLIAKFPDGINGFKEKVQS